MSHPLINQQAPKSFVLKNDKDESVDLSQIIGDGTHSVVLFFYPKDNTYGCTKEACSFRDNYERISELDAIVMGVSGDSARSHETFVKQHKLPFPLLSDKEGKLRSGLQVPKWYFGLPGRTTYVISKEGVILDVFDSQIGFNQHVTRAIKVLEENK
ncbi:peroxiredoxin [Phycomyces blakesleeanus]